MESNYEPIQQKHDGKPFPNTIVFKNWKKVKYSSLDKL